jgi:hypothetical protein
MKFGSVDSYVVIPSGVEAVTQPAQWARPGFPSRDESSGVPQQKNHAKGIHRFVISLLLAFIIWDLPGWFRRK